MENGLYSVVFSTPLGTGAGVFYAEDGQIRGGDSAMAYVGSYEDAGGMITARIRVTRHHTGIGTVFGIDPVDIVLKGQGQGAQASMNGTSPQAPGIAFSAKMIRIHH